MSTPATLTNVGAILEHGRHSILVGIEVHVSFPRGLPAGAVLHSDSNRLQWSKKLYNAPRKQKRDIMALGPNSTRLVALHVFYRFLFIHWKNVFLGNLF